MAPWRSISLTSLVAAYFVTSQRAESSKLFFIASFAGLSTVQFLVWGVWSVIIYPHLLSPLRGLPEPKGNSFIHGQWARIVKEPSGVPHTEWINTIPNDGVIRYRALLNGERVLVTNPKALAEVMVTKNYDFKKPGQLMFFLGRLLGVGVLLAEGDEHKFQRRKLMPAFAFRHIKDLYPVFWKIGREGALAITDHVLAEGAKKPEPSDAEKASDDVRKDTAVIEVSRWASRITLDVIGQAGLGRDFGAIRDPDNYLMKTYAAVFKPNPQAQLLGYLGAFLGDWLVSRLPFKRNLDINEARHIIRETCRDLIRAKKEKLARKELTDVDILSVAIESGGFTDENLVDQLMTFLAAGHETTASSMTWAVYLLCLHPEMQTRLREEIRTHLPSLADTDATVSSLDIDRMPYLNAFCNEALRYFAPVPLTTREAAVDTSIQGHFIPKGTRVTLCPWATNKDTALWGPDAAKFNPERWLPKYEGDKSAASGGATSNYALMTFIHGPRSCIGMNFAKAEFACLLATWVGRFEFRLRDQSEMDEKNMDIKSVITTRPAKGLHVYAKVLEGW